jgi:hypothetical protein
MGNRQCTAMTSSQHCRRARRMRLRGHRRRRLKREAAASDSDGTPCSSARLRVDSLAARNTLFSPAARMLTPNANLAMMFCLFRRPHTSVLKSSLQCGLIGLNVVFATISAICICVGLPLHLNPMAGCTQAWRSTLPLWSFTRRSSRTMARRVLERRQHHTVNACRERAFHGISPRSTHTEAAFPRFYASQASNLVQLPAVTRRFLVNRPSGYLRLSHWGYAPISPWG